MADDPAQVYRDIGVRPIITASGSTTMYGGSRLRPEAMGVMNKAATVMVHLEELNREAGKVIADVTGAEAGLVTSGAAGGLLLQAAACMAGADPAKMYRLPDSEGMRNEIVIQNSHRFSYDQAYRAAGARLVGVGDGRSCTPWELESAIGDRTAAVAYLVAPFTSRRALPLDQVIEVAHAKGVPVIVDAASRLPPRENLRRFIAQGADMVIFSGGKGIRGPQGTGVLCGRADLIEAAAANGSPNRFIGRSMKVAKEEIVGLVTALRLFVDEDEDAETREYTRLCQKVVDALIEVPGIGVSVEHDDYDYHLPTAVIRMSRDWAGPTVDEIATRLQDGDPPIYLNRLGGLDEMAVDPFNVTEDEMGTVIRRLREELVGG